MLRGWRGQRAFRVGCDLKQTGVGLLGDLDRDGLRVVARNVVASEPGKQAVARLYLAGRGRPCNKI